MKRFMALLLVFVSLSILAASAKNFSSVPFNDSFFSSSSLVRNDALAYASAQLADAVYQPGQIEEGLMAMGFEPPRLDNYQNLEQGLTDYAASAMSRKNMILNGKPYDLFAIVVRGTHDDIEWASDFNLGWGWDHAGFVQAESDLMENFREYYTGLEKGGKIDRNRDNNIIWITGHSRGAAVANLLAVQLLDYSYCPNEKIHAYTFACPRVTLQSIDQRKYQYIYNYNVLADIFPHLPPSGILNSGYRLYGNIIELESFTNMHTKVVEEYEKISGSSYNVLDKVTNHQMALYLSWMKVLYEETIGHTDDIEMPTKPIPIPIVDSETNSPQPNLESPNEDSAHPEVVVFGKYGFAWEKKPLNWLVLVREAERVLLITEMVIDHVPFHNTSIPVSWRDSNLREWLNSKFISDTFSTNEQDYILMTTNNTEVSYQQNHDAGILTQDMLFLLSISEVEQYFLEEEDRVAIASEHSDRRLYGVDQLNGGSSSWLLRSPGMTSDRVAFVAGSGLYDQRGWLMFREDYFSENSPIAPSPIRPAVWVRSDAPFLR